MRRTVHFANSKSSPQTTSQPRSLVYRALEPRMVFDAALVDTLAQATEPAASDGVTSHHTDNSPDALVAVSAVAVETVPPTLQVFVVDGLDPSTPTTRVVFVTLSRPDLATEEPYPVASSDPDVVMCMMPTIDTSISDPVIISSTTAPKELVVVDPSVRNPEAIIAAIADGANILILDAESDGLTQIAAYLQQHGTVSALHILSHGGNGQVVLGGSVLDSAALAASQSLLATIGASITGDGDILLYGCDVAADASGVAFVEALAALTGADVSASVDATGANAGGGDWLLEYATGTITAATIVAPDYAGLLALAAFDDVNSVSASSATAIIGNVLTNDTGTNPKTVTAVHGRAAAVGVAYQTSYGTITMNANGSYSYQVDVNNSTVLGLTNGQSITDIIAYTGRDAASATVDHGYLTITINGVSNPPVAYDNAASVTPVSAPTATGNLITDFTPGLPSDSVDRPQSLFRWETLYTNGAAVNGTSHTIDGVTVGVATTNISAGTFSATVNTGTQGGHTGFLAETIDPSALTYTAPTTTFSFDQPVVNLSFGLLDVDNGAPSWQDRVTITATLNGVPVTFQAQNSGWVTQSGNSFFGNNGGVNNTDANGNIVIVFDGPVDSVVVTYSDGPGATAANPGGHLIGISDLSWQNSTSDTVIVVNGTAVPAAGTTIPATYGTITVMPNGSYTYNVDPNNPAVLALPLGATLIDTIPYTIRDGLGQTDAANLLVTVNGINNVPVANADTATTLEDNAVTISAASLLANDTDVDTGDTFTITSVQAPVNGTVTLDGSGNPVFTPNANFVGIGSFTYTMRDANGLTATSTVTITVGPVNDAPQSSDALATISEDSVYTFSTANFALTDSIDTPANTLQAVVITTLPAASDGVLRLNGVAVTAGQTISAADISNLTFTPAGDRNGSGLGAFTFQVVDTGGTANGGVNTDPTPNTFQFDVTAVRDTVADPLSTLEDLPLSFNVLIGSGGAAADSFEGAAQVTAITQPANGTVAFAANGTMTFTPNANFNGTTSFTYTVTSGGVTETETVTITVGVVNDAPASTVPGAQTVNEDAPLVFSGATAISISDVDAGSTGVETVTLTAAHGNLTLGSTSGITGLSGNGTHTVTFSGTLAQINAALAGLSYQGDANYNGPDQLQIQLRDDGRDNGTLAQNGALPASISIVPITVVPVNDPPVAVNDTVGALEDTPVTIPTSTLLANDNDIDADTLTITSVQAPVNGTVTLDGSGNPVFTPTPNYFGPASFTYTIGDGNGGTSTATVNLVVAPANDAPVAVNDSYATPEDTVLTVPVATALIANDTDVDGGTLNVVQVNGNTISPGAPITLPSGAVLTPNANGTFAYDPNGAYDGLAGGATATDTFTYTVSDGNGGLATATATVTISGLNDPPVAIADTNSTDPRVAIAVGAASGVLANDTDPDTAQSALQVTAVGGGAVGASIVGSNGGTFVIAADGSYTFDPGTDFDSLPAGSSATTSISYTISDGQGGTSTATLTISVPYQNLPPFIANVMPPQTSTDGTSVSIATAQVFDDPNPIHQGNLTLSASGLPPGVSMAPNGLITGTLSADASQHAGPYIVTLTATDPSGGQISTTFQFTVANVGPVASNDPNSVGEHSTTTGNVLNNDDDGGNDGDALTVTAINGAPYSPGAVITLPSGAQIVMASDGSYSYDPHSAFNGMAVGATATDSFTYQVSDGQGGVTTATATITIIGQNDTPVIVDPFNPGTPPLDPNNVVPAQTGVDGTAITPISVTAYFADPDNGDTLALSVTGALPPGITFDPVTGTFSGTPASSASQGGPANNGLYTVLVNANDGHGGVVSTAVTFTIGNPAPIANNDSNTVAEHATTTGTVIGNDSDGGGDADALSVATVNGSTLVPGATITLPSGAQLVMQVNGAYTYDPNGAFAALGSNQTATDTFTYTISDGQGGTATAVATIVIQGQNDAPTATADTNATDPRDVLTVGATGGVLPNDIDPEGNALTVASIGNGTTTVGAGTPISGTGGGTFVIAADGSYTFDPGTAFDGLPPGTSASSSVTYTISDGQGGVSSTTLTITVPYTNLPPAVSAPLPPQSSQDGATIAIPVTSVFADPNPGDTLSITATGLPPGLTLNSMTGTIEGTLTADASQNGGQPYTVILTADDGQGGTVTSTFTFVVANPTPTAVDDANTVSEHGTTTGAVIGNDDDGGNDSDVLAVTQVNGLPLTPGSTVTLPSGALLVMQVDGTYSYDPDGAFNGLAVGENSSDSFTYQISDGQGGVSTATVTITVTGQNETPVIVDPANPGTPIDPNHVVPAQSGQDGSAIVPLNVTNFFGDADTTDTLTLAVDPAHLPPGVTFNSATGTFSGAPTPTASQGGNAGPGVYDVVVTASDGNGGSVSTTVRFTITNPAPVATNDNNTVAEHGTTVGAVLTNDQDGNTDGDTISVSQVNGAAVTSGATVVLPSGALLVMNTDGTYRYDPNGAFAYLQVGAATTDSFAYQISDGQGGFSTALVTIVINGQNDAPMANVDTNAVLPQGTIAVVAPLGLLSNDTDPESDPLVVTSITNGITSVAPGTAIAGSNGGTFTLNADGSYTFAAGNDFDTLLPGTTETTSITYTIDDGHGGTSTTTLTISVPFSNLPPVLNQPLPAQSSSDGSPILISVATVFRDPNPGDALTIDVNGLPPGLSYDPVTNQIIGTLDPDASQGGPYTVTLTATDPNGQTVTTTFDFAVGNPPPVALNDTNSVTEHGTIVGALATVNDRDGGADGDPLSVNQINGTSFTPGAVISLPSGALLTMQADGTYAYNPNGQFNGMGLGETASDSFTYQVSDGQGGFATATVAITITGVNDTPLLIDPTNPGVPVTPGVQVLPTHPALDGSPITPLNVTGVFADPDRNDALTLSVPPASLPAGITFDAATGTFSGTPTADASQGGPGGNGTYPIVVTATDPNGATVTTVVVIQISNPAPIAVADSNSVPENGTVSGSVTGNDRDGGADTDPLAVTQVNGTTLVPGATITLPSGALLVMNANGTYDYDPNGVFESLAPGQTATDTFTYQVSDGQGGFATAIATLVITGENDPPIVIDPVTGLPAADPLQVIPAQIGQDGTAITPVTVTSYFKDPDSGDSITLSVAPGTLPPGVVFNPATGTFSGTPTSDASIGGPAGNGVYPIVITATDEHGGVATSVIVFTFTNAMPVATDDTGTTDEDTVLAASVMPNDRDGGTDNDTLTVAAVNGVALVPGGTILLPSGAELVMNADGSYDYDPNGVFGGLAVGTAATDTFSYQISDGQGGTSTASVTITITGVNDRPIVIDPINPGIPPVDPLHVVPTQIAQDGSPITPISVAGVFTDPDTGDLLTLSVAPASLPRGIVFDPATGTFSGTPAADASTGGPAGNGTYPVVVTADDGHGGTVTTIVTFVISNPAPDARDDTGAVTMNGGPQPGTVLGNDVDGGADGDVLAVTDVNGTALTPGATITLPSGALLVMQADGTYTYDPNGRFSTLGNGQTATDTFTYQVSDGQGGFDTATVIVTIAAQNVSPIVIDPTTGLPPVDPANIVPLQIGRDGDVATALDITPYFTDANTGTTLTFSVPTATLPPGISFDPATGTFSGTPTAAASVGGPASNGIYPIVVTANDGFDGSVTTIVTFNISNPPPAASDDNATVGRNAVVAGDITDNDVDGGRDSDTLTVTEVNGVALVPGGTIALPSGALLTVNADGTYSYDPNGTHPNLGAGQTAFDSFSYTISDGNGGTAIATVDIVITGVNDRPIVVDPLNPGTPPSDPLHVVPVQSGLDGAALPALDITPYFTDPNPTDTLTFAVPVATLPPGITFDPVTGVFSGTPTADASQGGPAGNGIYTVVVTATDTHGGSTTTVVTFTIANPAPVANGDVNAVGEHATITGAVLSNDVDGGSDADVLTVAAVNGAALVPGATITLPSGGLLIMNADGTYDYTPNGAFDGLAFGETATDTFTYQVSDGQGGVSTATVIITINGANEVPVVVDPLNPDTPPADPLRVVPVQIGLDGAPITGLNVTPYFADADTSDTLTLAVVPGSLPPGITFDPATGMFSGTPTADASQGGSAGNGIYAVIVTATDPHGATVSTIVTFAIGNPAPIATNDVVSGNENGLVTQSVIGNDRDGGNDADVLTLSHVNGADLAPGATLTLPSGALLTVAADGTYVYNPNGRFEHLAVGETGTDTFTYQITDGQGGVATATVTITLAGQNDAPVTTGVVLSSSGQDGDPIAPLSVAGAFADVDASDVLTFAVPSGSLPPGIAFDPATGIFSGTPSADASQGGPNGDGIYPIIVTASDGHGGTVTTRVTFTFTNPLPIAIDDGLVRAATDSTLVLPVLANDRDGGRDSDVLTITAADATSGTVSINNDGTLAFTPAPGFAGLVTITYTISDGQGGTSTATALVLVTTTPQAPATPAAPLAVPGAVLPSNTGIASEGAVIAAVQSIEPLGSISGNLGTTGIIDATANSISGLGGLHTIGVTDPRITNPVWRLQDIVTREFGRSTDSWQPEGLTGFSLRFTYATDILDLERKAELVLDSLVRERTLIVNLSSTSLPANARVVDYRVMQADGQPLPVWLDRAGGTVLIGEPPVDVAAIKLRIVAILSDGTSIERHVTIQTMSGEIKPLMEKRADAVPTFGQQLQRDVGPTNNFEDVLQALRR